MDGYEYRLEIQGNVDMFFQLNIPNTGKNFMAFINAFREYWATPLLIKNFQERLQLNIKITLLIGTVLTVVLQFHPYFPFSFSIFYSWGIVAASFGGSQWLLGEVAIFFLSNPALKRGMQKSRKITVGQQWPLVFINFLVGYGVFVMANDMVIPLIYPEFSGVSDEIRTWGLFLKILPLWFFIAFVVFQMEIKKNLAGSLEQARQINRLLEQRNREFATAPLRRGSPSSSKQASPVSSIPESASRSFRIPGNNGEDTLDPGIISHISVEEHYSRIFVKKKQELEEIEVRISLKEALRQLPATAFVQIHRSHVINLAHVSHIKQSARSYRIFMGDQVDALPMSRHRVSKVLPILQEFLKIEG